MNSVVVHYQEIALKGRNRPWFIARLVRNIKTATSDLDVKRVITKMGRIEIMLGSARRVGACGRAAAPRLRHREFFARRARAARRRRHRESHPRRSRRSARVHVPRLGEAGRQAISADVAADRARSGRPHQGSKGGPSTSTTRSSRSTSRRSQAKRSTTSGRKRARAACRPA